MKSKQYSGSPAVKLKKLLITTKFSRERGAKPLGHQLFEMLWFWLARGFIPREYFRYQFYRKGVTLSSTRCYLSYRKLRKHVYPPKNALNDRWKNKGILYAELAEKGFPIPENVGILNPCETNRPRFPALDRERLNVLLKEPADYVLKPTELSEGRGIYFLDRKGERFPREGGEIASAEQVWRAVGSREYLLQRYVKQHPLLSGIYPHSVNTVRLVSFNRAGEIFIWGAVLRVGLGGKKTDNWHGGGLGIKIEGGVLKEGILVRGSKIMLARRHPDTGFEFYGAPVPFWPQCLELVKSGARAFADARAIGWDIAVAGSGPVVMEANVPFGAELLQMTQGGAFAGEVRREWVLPPRR